MEPKENPKDIIKTEDTKKEEEVPKWVQKLNERLDSIEAAQKKEQPQPQPKPKEEKLEEEPKKKKLTPPAPQPVTIEPQQQPQQPQQEPPKREKSFLGEILGFLL